MTRPISFLFALWEGGGNVTPTLEVVRKLVARGHRLRFIAMRAIARPGSREACKSNEVQVDTVALGRAKTDPLDT